ncbi:MAG: DUF2190 family protein [Selenomonadaceae bacterium]
MAKYISKGQNMPYKNSGATTIAAGTVVALASTVIGVAADDIAPDEEGTLFMTGVYELPAVNTAAISQGAPVYWDEAAGKVTPSALTGEVENVSCGYAWAAKAETGTVVEVRIDAFAIVITVEVPAAG